MKEEMLRIIIQQNYINMCFIQQILVEMGMNKNTLKKLQIEFDKEANRCMEEMFNEK